MKNFIFYLFLFIFILLTILGIFANFISPFNPNLNDFSNVNLNSNFTHFFGTDLFGRDIFSRVIFGLQNSLIIGICAGFLSTFIAILYASFASLNDKTNVILERLIDAFLSIPSILFIMLFSSISTGSIFVITIIIGFFSWMQSTKVFTQNFRISLKSNYVLQAKILGANHFELIFMEILPNLKNLILTLFGINITHAITTEATLSFFGIGCDLNQISLGIILNESLQALFLGAWKNFFYPCFVLFLLILSIMILTGSIEKKGIKI